MKIYRDLYPQICAFENLYQAYRAARLGKRDKAQVCAFEWDVESELLRLQTELTTQTYRPGPYHSFHIQDRKRRLISAAPFRDRVVHHALVQVIEPIFERQFIGDSYANRKSKGTHRALDRCQHFARGHRYVLKCDIERFFPSVDHAVLRSLLARPIDDPPTLRLINAIIDSGAGVLGEEYSLRFFPDDDLFAALRPRGLPIGNLTSQFWANVYLNELDQFVKRHLRCRAYVRYVDDFLLFADDKLSLHAWRERLTQFLAALRLTIHPRKSVVFPVAEGIDFLGFRVFPTHRRLRRDNVRAFVARFRAQRERFARGELAFADFQHSVQSWIAHAAHGDTYRLRGRLFAQFPISAR